MRGIVEAAPVPPELVPTPQPVAATSIPTFFDQLFSYTTATELLERMVEPELASYLGGVPNLDSDDFIAILGSVPLEPAIRLSTWVQRRLRLDPTNAAKQLETMELLYGPVFRAAGELLLREHPRRALFSEQQAFALQRLLRSWTILIDPTRPSDGRRPGSRALAVDRPAPFRRGASDRAARASTETQRRSAV